MLKPDTYLLESVNDRFVSHNCDQGQDRSGVRMGKVYTKVFIVSKMYAPRV